MSEIKPALTAEEWAVFPSWTNAEPGEWQPAYFPRPHGIAAVNLNDQPFGFTREMVEAVRTLDSHNNLKWDQVRVLWDLVRSMADRIEALLPPEETHATQEEQPSGQQEHQQVR